MSSSKSGSLRSVSRVAPVRKSSTPQQRDQVVEMIVDSWITHPKQDSGLTASESRRIAAKVFGRTHADEYLGSVAAIRANFTMGRYGNVTTLKRNRKRQLKAV